MTVLIDGMRVTTHIVTVPLDWLNPNDGRTLSVAVREVVQNDKADDDLPALCYFRGGPGFQAPGPLSNSNWLAENLSRHRVFLLDQRGTGRSCPIDAATLIGRSDHDLAEYLTHFRADSIVRDAEHIRRTILGDKTKWTIHGQSFGGFCTLTYLSLFPASLSAAIITGGFAPIGRTALDVYRTLRDRVIERNISFYDQFPDDRVAVRNIVDHLRSTDVQVTSDWRLSDRQFLTLGNKLGAQHGAAKVHEFVDRAQRDIETIGTLSRWTISNASDVLSLSTNPIYALLHEAIYCSGHSSRWAAATAIKEDPRFHDDNAPYFTGEMIFPWMFDEMSALRPFRATAEMLAQKSDWSDLYNLEALRSNDVPVVGTIYFDDLYVDRNFALQTAELVGNCDYWITNEYEHNGYEDDAKRVMGRLFSMLDERLTIRSINDRH